MAVIEQDGLFSYIDSAGNTYLLYPVTKLANVEGGDELVKIVTQSLTDAQKSQARTNIGAAASSHSHTKSDITDFPTTFTLAAHSHTKSDITDFPYIKKASVSLSADGWNGSGPFSQSVALSGVTANSKVDLQPDSTVLNQFLSDNVSALYIQNDSGTLTAYALGSAPTAALTIQVTITEVTV